MMTAEEFILIPKHLYVKEQPHAARVLHDNNIKHYTVLLNNCPILTGLDPNYLHKLVRLLQRRKHLRIMMSPNKNSLNC